MNRKSFKNGLVMAMAGVISVCISHSTFATPGRKAAPALTKPSAPRNTFVYIADFQAKGLAQFRQDKNGALVPLAPSRAPIGKAVARIVTDRAGRFVYILHSRDNTISHGIIRKDGSIMPRHVPDVKVAQRAEYLFLDEAGGMAYAMGMGEEKLYRYSLGRDGVLKPLPSLQVKGAGRVIAFFGPTRKALYVCYALKKDYEQLEDKTDFDETKIPVHYDVYRTQGTALPKRVASLVVPGGNLIFEPKGRFAYISRRDVIGCYQVGNDGTLNFTGDVKLQTGKRTVGITFDPKGRFAYVNHVDNGRSVLSQFRLDEKGVLVPLLPQTVPIEGRLVNETLDPSGRYLYTTNVHTGNTLDRFVVPFRIAVDGRLQRITPKRIETGNNAGLPEFDPSGRFAYIGTMVHKSDGKSSYGRIYYSVLSFRVAANGNLIRIRPDKIRMNYFWNMVFVKK